MYITVGVSCTHIFVNGGVLENVLVSLVGGIFSGFDADRSF